MLPIVVSDIQKNHTL
uniref:Uncharacterized protein n=1 Tax=Arundo donax TaxID=35708 RepID=A0A0A9ATS3_ARUDO